MFAEHGTVTSCIIMRDDEGRSKASPGGGGRGGARGLSSAGWCCVQGWGGGRGACGCAAGRAHADAAPHAPSLPPPPACLLTTYIHTHPMHAFMHACIGAFFNAFHPQVESFYPHIHTCMHACIGAVFNAFHPRLTAFCPADPRSAAVPGQLGPLSRGNRHGGCVLEHPRPVVPRPAGRSRLDGAERPRVLGGNNGDHLLCACCRALGP